MDDETDRAKELQPKPVRDRPRNKERARRRASVYAQFKQLAAAERPIQHNDLATHTGLSTRAAARTHAETTRHRPTVTTGANAVPKEQSALVCPRSEPTAAAPSRRSTSALA
jgi:hypothetical protein